jgi:hypothetical protein
MIEYLHPLQPKHHLDVSENYKFQTIYQQVQNQTLRNLFVFTQKYFYLEKTI